MTKAERSRRVFLQQCGTATGALVLGRFVTGCAAVPMQDPLRRSLVTEAGTEIVLRIANTRIPVAGRLTNATTLNGGIPGPEIRLTEGDEVRIRVTNELDEDTSVHWHGVLVPPAMDGVPGVSFDGIAPGTTFEYRIPIRQSGTYWYHSHSGFQEQTGIYGPLIIEPKEPEPYEYEREYTIVLSDWTFEDPDRVLANLKKYGGYYNYQRRTLSNLGAEAETKGFWGALSDRFTWGRMRMDATDISDVTGITYTYLMNGLSPFEGWRGLFTPGDRVRLRFINASAASYFDVRIPGLPMQVIHADGQAVEPIDTDEFRLAIAETLDVIVEPTGNAHTIFAEAMDRSGHALGRLAINDTATSPVPPRRARPQLTMADMGMAHGAMNMDHGDMDMKPKPEPEPMDHAHMGHGDMGHGDMGAPTPDADCRADLDTHATHNQDGHGPGNAMVAAMAMSRLEDPGVGLDSDGWRVLTYSQLRRAHALADASTDVPTRTIELHLTGNMERYMWSFDGEQFHHGMPAIQLRYLERIRFVLINDTMMAHPIHLHGMFFELDVGACERNPLKHTVNVKPAERVSFLLTADEIGRWAFHCHILYHMEAGMFRVVEVSR